MEDLGSASSGLVRVGGPRVVWFSCHRPSGAKPAAVNSSSLQVAPKPGMAFPT